MAPPPPRLINEDVIKTDGRPLIDQLNEATTKVFPAGHFEELFSFVSCH
jgi:hypothetical protein